MTSTAKFTCSLAWRVFSIVMDLCNSRSLSSSSKLRPIFVLRLSRSVIHSSIPATAGAVGTLLMKTIDLLYTSLIFRVSFSVRRVSAWRWPLALDFLSPWTLCQAPSSQVTVRLSGSNDASYAVQSSESYCQNEPDGGTHFRWHLFFKWLRRRPEYF